MKRVVSVWLPAWPISRLKRAEPQAVPLQQPFALVESGVHGLAITAVNGAAARPGLSPVRPSAMRVRRIPHSFRALPSTKTTASPF